MSTEKTKRLFEAIREGKLDLVKELIVFQRAGVNSGLEYSGSPLVQTVKSPLVQAVEFRQLEIVKFLVEVKANANWMDNRYGTPCFIAKQLGFQEIADYLEPFTNPDLQAIAEDKANPDILRQDNHSIVDLLAAIDNENVQRVQELIDLGVDVNTKFEDDLTPLILAARKNHLQIVELLVRVGADTNALDKDFESALLAAKVMHFKDIEEYLEPLTSLEIREMIEQQMSD